MDQGGYLVRSSLYGAGFFTFRLTGKGRAEIPDVRKYSATENMLPAQGVSILQAISDQHLPEYAKQAGISNSALSAWFSVLERKHFIKQIGFMRRRVVLSQEGKRMLQKQ